MILFSIAGGLKLNIILISEKNPYAPNPSGVIAYIRGLVSNLDDKVFDITIISSGFEGEEPIPRVFNKIQIPLKKVTSINFFIKLFIKSPFMRFPPGSIIHFQRPDFVLPFALFHGKIPKVCTLHGNPNLTLKLRKNPMIWFLYNALEKIGLRKSDRLITVDGQSKEFYIKKYSYIKQKIETVPIGIDTGVFRPLDKKEMRNKYGFAQDEVLIIAIGRFSIEKGYDQLILAFEQLRLKIHKARLILLGEGPEEKSLKNLVATHKIQGVEFRKPIKHNLIPELLNCADVFVLSSTMEGLPTVVLEALACGIPVIATNVGDAKEVVLTGKTGVLIGNNEPETIKNAIMKIIDEDTQKYMENCRTVALKYSWEKIVDKITKVYRDVEGSS